MSARVLSIILAASVALCSGIAVAQSSGVKTEITESSLQELLKDADPLVDMVRLPIQGMQAVENEDGQILFIADSGRFAIVGQLVDVWQVKTLDTMRDIKSAVARIDLRGDGVDVETLNIASFGSGDKEVIVFTDPQCSICTKVMEDAEKLGDEYTFRFVVIPALGDESHKLARQFFCAADPSERYSALKNNTISSLKTKSDCNIDRYDQTLMIAHMISVDGVPFILSPKGDIHRGRPANLKDWLQEDGQAQLGSIN